MLGYTPDQVYDLFFRAEFCFLCNPIRLAVCGSFGHPEDRLWRFKLVVRSAEDGNELSSQSKLYEIILPYLTHLGSRYGLSTSITYPIDCIETRLSARICNKWALGRFILCGDVFLPFGGQGIASGFRDACSLAWRPQLVCQPKQSSSVRHKTILKTWYRERKQQCKRSLAASVENGAFVTESNTFRIALRNVYLDVLQLFPSGKRCLEKGARRDGMFSYDFQDGMRFVPQLHGGKLFPQVFCAPSRTEEMGEAYASQTTSSLRQRSRGLFQLVVLVRNEKELATSRDEQALLYDIHDLSNGYIAPCESTRIVEDTNARATDVPQSGNITESEPNGQSCMPGRIAH